MARAKPKTRRRIQFEKLEDRALARISGLLVNVKPQVLVPPNNRIVNVIVSGKVSETRKGVVPSVILRTVDEYRQFEPGRVFTLKRLDATTFSFRARIHLQAKRVVEFPEGRHYFLSIAAQDQDGATGQTIPVLVPVNANAKVTPRSDHAPVYHKPRTVTKPPFKLFG